MLNKLLPQNQHILERVGRVVVGGAAVAAVFVGPQTPFGWLGLILVVTGAVGSCPIYAITGLSTSPKEKANAA